MLPAIPPWFSSAAINTLIAVESAAQPQIWAKRLRRPQGRLDDVYYSVKT
jgi:hypothetical protein